MKSQSDLHMLLHDADLDDDLKAIAHKVESNERISFEEGVLLYEKAELPYLGILANYIRHKRHGNNVYFNRNLHIESTN